MKTGTAREWSILIDSLCDGLEKIIGLQDRKNEFESRVYDYNLKNPQNKLSKKVIKHVKTTILNL